MKVTYLNISYFSELENAKNMRYLTTIVEKLAQVSG